MDNKKPSLPECAWKSELFSSYRNLVGHTSEAPDAFSWGALLGVLSFLIGRDAFLGWGSGQQTATVFVALLGTTGRARKSTAIDDAVRIVARRLIEQDEGIDSDLTEIVVGTGSGEGFTEALADGSRAGEKGGLAAAQTGRRALLVVHELAGLLGKIERGQAGNMLEFLIRLFDCADEHVHITRHNGAKKEIRITRATGVLLAASTEDWLLEHLTGVHVMNGFANRILWLSGDRKGPLAFRPEIPAEDIENFCEDVRRCLSAVRDKRFQLFDDARALHEEHYELQYRARYDNVLEEAAVARADILALRIAMLLAVGDGSAVIGREHISAAWAVVKYSNAVATAFIDRLRLRNLREVEDRVSAACIRVADEMGGTFSKREIFQRLKGKTGLDSETFSRSWSAMLEAGAIVPSEVSAGRFRIVI